MKLKINKLLSFSAISSAVLLASSVAYSHSQGDVIVRIGQGTVMPNESSNDPNDIGELELDDDTSFTGTITYMLSDNIGIEALLMDPFDHNVTTDDSGDVGEFSYLPLSFTAQYYFGEAASTARPYVGLGFNYTTFSDEEIYPNNTAEIGSSSGLAIQAGVDYRINELFTLSASAWYLDIETTVIDSAIQDIDLVIDPLIVLVGIGYTF